MLFDPAANVWVRGEPLLNPFAGDVSTVADDELMNADDFRCVQETLEAVITGSVSAVVGELASKDAGVVVVGARGLVVATMGQGGAWWRGRLGASPLATSRSGRRRRTRVQRRVQVDGAVTDVVMRHALRGAGQQREHRLGSVQSLHGGLLVSADDNGMIGRVHVEGDDVCDLVHEQGVAR
jgi:hypothetical protein